MPISLKLRPCHLTINVSDLECSEALYRYGLAAEHEPIPAASTPVYRKMRLPGQVGRLLLQLPRVMPERGHRPHRMRFDIASPDPDGTVARFLEQGAERVRTSRGSDLPQLQD